MIDKIKLLLNIKDDDMMAAILVASIDFRKENKEDFKVISCKCIDQEKKK